MGYVHGFPNLHEQNYGHGVVYGTFLIAHGSCEWRDVPAVDLGLGTAEPSSVPMDRWFMGAHDYAWPRGYVTGMPNGHYANYGHGYVCGVFLFPQGKAEWRDIPGRELGLPDVGAPPPPPPPTPPQATVPQIISQTLQTATGTLQAAGLKIGFVVNQTGSIDSTKLFVTHQDPTAGQQVPQGSSVNARVESTQPPPPGQEAMENLIPPPFVLLPGDPQPG